MPKKTAIASDPYQGRIDALRAIGLAVEQTQDGKRWKVTPIGKSVPWQGMIGFPTREAAIERAENHTTQARRYVEQTDQAWADYQTAIGYTHADPEMWMKRYNAAYEYERTELVRLGLPVRKHLARGHGWRKG